MTPGFVGSAVKILFLESRQRGKEPRTGIVVFFFGTVDKDLPHTKCYCVEGDLAGWL